MNRFLFSLIIVMFGHNATAMDSYSPEWSQRLIFYMKDGYKNGVEERRHEPRVTDSIKQALEKGADPNVKYDGNSLLHFAVRFNTLSIAKRAVSKGAFVDATDKDGFTPLLRAAQSNRTNSKKIFKFFVEHGADVNFKSPNGASIHSLGGNEGPWSYIPVAGAEFTVPVIDEKNYVHALYSKKMPSRAATKLIKLIKLSAQAEDLTSLTAYLSKLDSEDQLHEINGHNLENETPLMVAITNHNIPAAKLLITFGARPALPTRTSWEVCFLKNNNDEALTNKILPIIKTVAVGERTQPLNAVFDQLAQEGTLFSKVPPELLHIITTRLAELEFISSPSTSDKKPSTLKKIGKNLLKGT